MKPLYLLILFSLFFDVKAFSQTKNFIDQPYLEVSGYADTLVTPDQIFLRIILSEKDTKDKITLEEQEIKMAAALKNLGINTESDLSVKDLASNYKYHLFKQKGVLKTKEYVLKVVSANMASKVFIKLEELSIANVTVDKVQHSELEQLQNICRTRAIENARNKAVALTKPLSQSIGNAIHITEASPNAIVVLQGKAAGVMVRGSRDKLEEFEELPIIEFEKIEVYATVNVVFILK